ncbi:MAG: Ig-like domain-containing protein, partial [Firmicutes bacterium]|nr:Ig-like domain-containing protein [Bacillota bacterium]
GHASGYRAGGLVGGFSGGRGSNITIENSFALGEAESIDAAGSSGGILGFAAISDSSCEVTIENCYAAVQLKGNTSKKGGMFGERHGGRGVINVINCYYNADLNPELSPSSYNIPKTTSELKSIDTFSTWDIVESIDNTKIWNMKSGLSYPWLAKIPRPLTPDFPAPVPVTGVSLNKERITLNIGKEGSFEAETLTATIYPSDADNKMLLWTSGNPEVARVDENGKVIAVAEGTAIITVTTEDGGYTDTCDVVVEFVPPVISFMPNGSMQPQQTISTTVTIEGYVERNSLQGIWSAEADPAKITNWEDIGGLFGPDMNAATVTLSNTDGEYYYHVKGVNVLGEDVVARTEKFVVGQSFIDAFNAVESAELSTIQGDVDSAWIYVNNLPESESKVLLRDRLNAVQYIIDSRPGIPENISISATSDQIILVYSAVNNATRYEIEVDGEIINNGSNLTYTHSNLLPNQQHSYRIRALNEYGAGSWSEQLTISTILKAPDNLSAKSTNKSITITWEATEGAEEYDVEANGIVVGSTSATSFVHSALIPDREYTYRVRSKKSGYVSDWSSELIQRTSVNHSPVLAIIGDKSVQAGDSLKFTVHATDIDNDTLIYRADNLPDGAAFDSATAAFVWTPDNTQTGTYEGIHFEVTDGFTTVSEKMTITVSPSPISVPQNVYGIPSYNSITVTWDEVPNTTGYEIEADGSSQTVAETVYTHTGLLPGTQHYYRVRAFNIEMVSEWSNVITVSTAVYHNMLEAPRNLVAELEGTGIRLTWDQVAGASSYDINADGKLRTVTEAVYLHEGLQPNTQYTYRVRAKSAAGMSDWSEVLTVSIPQTAGGSGTIEDPYLIGTAEQLYNIRYDLAAHYKIINDIDLIDYAEWEPIGSRSVPFAGSLDGANYVIKNLNIHRDDDYTGLFSCIENVVLKNIKIELGEKGITGYSRTGALVGYGKSSTMENCSVAGPGKVHGNIYVGGLIGEIESSTITGCSSAV